VDTLKRDVVAGLVRDMIADGTLRPGAPVPRAAELARKTGYATSTCAGGLRALLADGTITRGVSPAARLWVPLPGGAGDADALRVSLSRALAARRHAAGMTQPELATALDVSVTTVGHAETGRLWQGRHFWQRADALLGGYGDLLRMFDDWQAAEHAAPAQVAGDAPQPGEPGELPGKVTRGLADELLTDEEREAVRLAGMLYTLIADHVTAAGPNRESDLAEVRALVHGIQYRVMANAAARAYPGEFRLLGAVLAGHSPAAVRRPGE
jgi:hypothetical protein